MRSLAPSIPVKALKGFGGRGVLEIVDDFDSDTFRAVYTVRFAEVVYVLHAFQKKSKKGIATPRREIDLIKSRLKRAEEHYRTNYSKGRMT
jgi:phage-related protein